MSSIETQVQLEPKQTKRFDVAPWQLEDLQRLVERTWSANWSEMGARKTTTGLWLAEAKLRGIENPNVLVVTTKSGKGTFFDIAPEVLEGWSIFNVTTKDVRLYLQGKELKLPGIDVIPKKFAMPALVVTHYDVFSDCNKGKFKLGADGRPVKGEDGRLVQEEWRAGDYMIDREWDFVWIDEAHRLKNKDTRWTKNLKKVQTKEKHISTGTGFINRPAEIWSLLNFLDRKVFSSYNRFVDEYCEIDDYGPYRKILGVKPEMRDEFRTLVREVGVRRTLTEVMPDIAEPVFVNREVDLNTIQRRMYNQIKAELKALDKNGTPLHAPNVISALQRMRQISVATPEVISEHYDQKQMRRVLEVKLREPSSKLDAVMDIVEELSWDDDAKQPVVIFSNFRDPLELLERRFEKAGISYIHMKQKDNDQERLKKWAFEFPKLQHQVFMSTLQLGSESINLTPARHVIFLDRSWSPAHNSQGIGRIRRPGQKGQPVVININARKTVDQYIEKVVTEKTEWFRSIFHDDDDEGDNGN